MITLHVLPYPRTRGTRGLRMLDPESTTLLYMEWMIAVHGSIWSAVGGAQHVKRIVCSAAREVQRRQPSTWSTVYLDPCC